MNKKQAVVACFLLLVEMTGVEPVSESLAAQPSSWTVVLLSFPRKSAERHALSLGSPFVHGRVKGESPTHVHRLCDAQSLTAVRKGGTGGIRPQHCH